MSNNRKKQIKAKLILDPLNYPTKLTAPTNISSEEG